MRINRLTILLLGLLAACKTTQVATKTNYEYNEDLTLLRPEIIIDDKDPQESESVSETQNTISYLNIKNTIDSVNQQYIAMNAQAAHVDGYTVQIYTGPDREAATMARGKAMAADSTIIPTISYYQPTYKVKVGQYLNKLEAYSAYESMKILFPRALLLPERIKVNYE